MDKPPLREEEIKELEDEIDLAVDRLFVEKRKGGTETLPQGHPGFEPSKPEPSSAKIPNFEPSLETLESPLESLEGSEKGFDFEQLLPPPPPTPSPLPPPSHLKALDQLEAQLLALEWEITEEKLQNTQEAVRSLNQLLKQRNDIASVLGFMDDLLKQMEADEEKIRPPMITFLLDAKETIKLLLRKETDGELTIYKQLSLAGLEARFAAFQGRREVPDTAAPVVLEKRGPEQPPFEWKKIEEKAEEVFSQWTTFLGRAEETFRRIDRRLSDLEGPRPEPSLSSERAGHPLMEITIFETCGRYYGIESQRVSKLFRVPPSFQEKYGAHPKVRVKDFDVNLIDLRKIVPEESWNREEAARLLVLHGEGGYKGLIVGKVLKRIRVFLEEPNEDDKKFVLGIFHWTYQSHSVEVAVLDAGRL